MTIPFIALCFVGGIIGSWLEQKYGPVVVLGYGVALVALGVVYRFVTH